jgi:RND family efflux transporter MFP subunit
MKRPMKVAAGAAMVFALAACKEREAAPPPPVRPVLSVVVAPQTLRVFGFAGTVEPRYRASLGFRVLGRIIARDANVGDVVKKGQRLAAIDPLALELAVRAAQADVSNASAQFANASATEARQRALVEQSAATQAVYEAAQQGRDSAAAALARAQANLAKAEEQLGYAQLRSDYDGVVTAIDAEVGQVVSPGQNVATIARPEIREAVVDVPDAIADTLRPGARFDTVLQLDQSVRATGAVREIAPQSDATTRSRRVRITLDDPPSRFRLGTIVTAVLTTPTVPRLELPVGALLERDGQTSVWVVDPATATVSPRPVRVGTRGGGVAEIAEGLAPGTRVVIAGIHSLTAGQSVKLLDEAPR